MPPKKAAGKGKEKGKKKAALDSGPRDFSDYLNEVHFISPSDMELKRKKLQRQVKDAFTVFRAGADEEVCNAAELGALIRTLGLNPSEAQLRTIMPLVEDASIGNVISYAKFEPLMLNILLNNELVWHQGDEEKREMMVRDTEAQFQAAWEVLWDHGGKKLDSERQPYIDGDVLRELLMSTQCADAFDEGESTECLHAVADPETGFVKQDALVVVITE
jgi:hypothetical protein